MLFHNFDKYDQQIPYDELLVLNNHINFSLKYKCHKIETLPTGLKVVNDLYSLTVFIFTLKDEGREVKEFLQDELLKYQKHYDTINKTFIISSIPHTCYKLQSNTNIMFGYIWKFNYWITVFNKIEFNNKR